MNEPIVLGATIVATIRECARLGVAMIPRPGRPAQSLDIGLPGVAGTIRHHAIRCAYLNGPTPPSAETLLCLARTHDQWTDLPPEMQADCDEWLAHLVTRTDLWPDPDDIIAQEESGYPTTTDVRGDPGYLAVLGAVGAHPVHLVGRMDLVLVKSGQIVIRDWKTRHHDYRTQAAIYALAAMVLWPGWDVYTVELCYLAEGARVETLPYTVAELEQVREDLLTLAHHVNVWELNGAPATPCRQCTGCPLRSDCPAYQTALQPMEPTQPARTWPTDLDELGPQDLLQTYLDFSAPAGLVEEYLSRLRRALQMRMGPGCRLVNQQGEGVKLVEHRSREYDLAEALEWAGRYGFEGGDVAKPQGIEALRRLTRRIVVEDRRKAALAELDQIGAEKIGTRLMPVKGGK